MPIEESIILALLQGTMRERHIPPKSIRQWTDPRLSVYIATLTVNPSGRQQTDRERGAFLIRETIKWALTMNRQFDIKNWYGIGATQEGQHLFESLGFSEIIPLYHGERKGYRVEDIKQPVLRVNRLLAEINRQENTQKQEATTARKK